jgi:transcriptional regulator with XRE-family HTH domain
MDIGRSIKQLRKHHCISQLDFAKHVGISQTFLSLVESGKRDCSIHFLESIAKGLDIPLPVLFWFSIEAKDIPDDKKEHFEFLKPSIDALIKSIF